VLLPGVALLAFSDSVRLFIMLTVPLTGFYMLYHKPELIDWNRAYHFPRPDSLDDNLRDFPNFIFHERLPCGDGSLTNTGIQPSFQAQGDS
jgi:hypothetical protein